MSLTPINPNPYSKTIENRDIAKTVEACLKKKLREGIDYKVNQTIDPKTDSVITEFIFRDINAKTIANQCF